MRFTPFLIARQKFPSYRIADVRGEVQRTLDAAQLGADLKPGSSIAIGVGSRGIAHIDVIVGGIVTWWKGRGMKPFLFPAMGSHGAASATGQAEVLAKYGITEATMSCPIRSSLDVVSLGRTPEGIETVMDRAAHSADGVMLCARVKWHTDFAGTLESGLFKMMAIGLGKFDGAKRYHAFAHTLGLEQVIRSVGRQVLSCGKILGGLAILEDGNHDTARLASVRVEEMEQREMELLALVKTWMPRIPVGHLHFLLVDQIGKNLSGSGVDPKVINRSVHGAYNPWPFAPRVDRVYLRGIHPLSYGNAVGFGMADMVHERLLKKMKREPTWVNGITSGTMASIKTPVHYPSDRRCLEETWRTAGCHDPMDLRIGWIRNSQDLSLMAFTENLRGELEGNADVEILSGGRELEFDEAGDLREWLT